jgi:hypothetical protein
VDVAPKQKTTLRGRVAQLVRQFGDPEHGGRANAWRMLQGTMNGAGINWSDVGNWIEDGESKYTEDELQQYGQAKRAEGVEAGIKIGEARKSNGGGNGYITVPNPSEIANFCHQRLSRMKDDAQRRFVRESYETIQGEDIYRLDRWAIW